MRAGSPIPRRVVNSKTVHCAGPTPLPFTLSEVVWLVASVSQVCSFASPSAHVAELKGFSHELYPVRPIDGCDAHQSIHLGNNIRSVGIENAHVRRRDFLEIRVRSDYGTFPKQQRLWTCQFTRRWHDIVCQRVVKDKRNLMESDGSRIRIAQAH